MGILSNIFHKIFPGSAPKPAPAPAQAQAPKPAAPAPAAPAAPQAQPQAQAQAQAAPMQQVDVEQILNDMQKSSGQQLNWRTSIVDLLKLLGLDSSLASRKELGRAALHRRHQRFRHHEHLAAPPGHEQAGGERRQGAGRLA